MPVKPKIAFKLEQIARLRLFAGLKDGQIAELMGLSQSGFSRIIALPEYLDIEKAQLDGGITALDEAVAGKAEEMKKLFAPAVPAAMRTLIDAVTQRRDLRTAVAAAIHVIKIDPDHTFSEASKDATNASVFGVSASSVPASIMATAVAANAAVAASSKKDMN